MIDIRELRVGNIVNIDNNLLPETIGKRYTITAIDGNRINTLFPNSTGVVSLKHTDSLRTYNQFNEFISPIVLTSEILDKYGFELYKSDNPDQSDWCWVKRDISFVIWNKSFILQKLNIEIKSLHQLQNLYFDFTGKELVKNK